MGVRQVVRSALVQVVGLACAVWLAGCTDAPTSPGRRPAASPATTVGIGVQGEGTAKRDPIERVGVDVGVSGSFRPNQPLTVTARAHANRASANTNFELFVLGADTLAISPAGARAGRRVAERRGALGRGATATLTQQISFPEPGYYQIAVRAVSEPTADDTPGRRWATGGPEVSEFSVKVVHVLVEERGGRVTDGWDARAAADSNRVALFGGLGPFRPGPARRAGTSARAPAGPGSGDVTAQSSVSGRVAVRYPSWDADVNGNPTQQVGTAPLWGAHVKIVCTSNTSPQYPYISDHVTGQDGFAYFNCPSPADQVEVLTDLTTSYARVYGGNGMAVTVVQYYYPSSTGYVNADVVIGNGFAARFALNLYRYVPDVHYRFGRTRQQVEAWVEERFNGGAQYLPANDRIYSYRNTTFGPYGSYVAAHEYGHAFHYRALGGWRTLSCPSPHYVNQPSGLSCGFVEGFANFVSAWISGKDTQSSFGLDDYWFEVNPWRAIGDGSQIEGPVASFFLDMADDLYQLDEVAGDDDSYSGWGSYIGSVIATCQVDGIGRLDGVDEFIYCAERNVNARAANPYNSWRAYSSFSEGATEPTGWSPSVVRSFWQYNLFGLGALP